MLESQPNIRKTIKARYILYCLLILLIFTFPTMSCDRNNQVGNLSSILRKHNLHKGQRHTWETLNILEAGLDPSDYRVQLRWINNKTRSLDPSLEPINPDVYIKQESVKTILQKSSEIFTTLVTNARVYIDLVNDLERLHQGATELYDTHIPDKDVAKEKRRDLHRLREFYSSIVQHSHRVYNHGLLIEDLMLPKVRKPIVIAYSRAILDEIKAKIFAEDYRIGDIQVNEKNMEQALRDINQETERLKQKSIELNQELFKVIKQYN